MLKRLISGMQTGSDLGSIIAAKSFGIETGGTMPHGFLTEDGSKPEFAQLYGAIESESSSYQPRTYDNVKNSDGTIRIAFNLNSAGEKCTLKAIEYYKKPYFDVHIKDINTFALPIEIHPQTAAKWIITNGIEVLNCAGNRESTAKGISKWAERYMTAVFKYIKGFEVKK